MSLPHHSSYSPAETRWMRLSLTASTARCSPSASSLLCSRHERSAATSPINRCYYKNKYWMWVIVIHSSAGFKIMYWRYNSPWYLKSKTKRLSPHRSWQRMRSTWTHICPPKPREELFSARLRGGQVRLTCLQASPSGHLHVLAHLMDTVCGVHPPSSRK